MQPAISPTVARTAILESADPVPALEGKVVTGGRLNVYRVLAELDSIPPSPIRDLRIDEIQGSWVRLAWTATGDDSTLGQAQMYEVRYAPHPIDELNFDDAALAEGAPVPSPAGTPEEMTISGFEFSTSYWFAVRVFDVYGNSTSLSNVANVRTLAPPDIAVAPPSLSASLSTGGLDTREVTLSNEGIAELNYTIAVRPDPTRRETPTVDDLHVMIVDSGVGTATIVPPLLAFPEITEVTVFDGGTGTPTIDDLLGYDVVLLMNTEAFHDRDALGDVVADFADLGGGVIVAMGSFWQSISLGGRFLEEGYGPFEGAAGLSSASSLGPYQAAHPVFDGVASVSASSIANAPLSAGASLVASWSNGQPFVATRGNVVGANVVLGWNEWQGDVPRLLRNAVLWSSRRLHWLVPDHFQGKVNAGTSKSVAVALDARQLAEGEHLLDLVITSDDPDEPATAVPILLSVQGAPDVTVEPSALDFETVLVATQKALTFLVTNQGAAELQVSDVVADPPEYTVEPRSFSLAPYEDQTVTVTFHPRTERGFPGTLTLTSDDPDQPVSEVTLSGVGLDPPDVTLAPESLGAALFTGESHWTTVVIGNEGSSDLRWEIVASPATSGTSWGPPPPPPPLEHVLEELDEHHPSLAGLVPARYDFTEGATGDHIVDGGSNLYDQGNYLNTPFGTFIDYSDGQVVDSAEFGSEGRYFTRKVPGLFVCAADLDGVDWFRIRGNLGQDGAGFVDGTMLKAKVGGADYLGFVKRVYGASTPSVNHLVIVPDLPGISQQFSSDSNIDLHTVNGLSGCGRLYYLLYSGASGQYVDDDATLGIMTAFLTRAVAPTWLEASPESGTTGPGDTCRVSVELDADGLAGGGYTASLVVRSDDPDEPQSFVEASLVVTGAPDLQADRAPVDFGTVLLGQSGERILPIRNSGAEPLEISRISVGPSDYAVDPPALSLAVGEEATISVTFTPTTPGPATTVLELSSNDPDEPVVSLPVDGLGLEPADVTTSSSGLTAELTTGETVDLTFRVENTGYSDLEWQIEPALPASPGGTPSLETVLDRLEQHREALSASIPNRFDFEEGETGNHIVDGGENMYDLGNYMKTPLANNIEYTNGVIQPGPQFGPAGRYFTHKLSGLFLCVADIDGIASFQIRGNLGQDGQGDVDNATLRATAADVGYVGFTKRVHGFSTPSVNHLMVAEDRNGIVHEPWWDSNVDYDLLLGLENSQRLYYLLYAGNQGHFYDEAATLRILSGFLSRIVGPTWLEASPASGSTPPGGSTEITVTFAATGSSGGPLRRRPADGDE